MVRTLQHTFLPSLGHGHIPTNILHQFCCSGHQELFGGQKKSPTWSESHKTGPEKPPRAQPQGTTPALSRGRVRVCPCSPGEDLSCAEHEGHLSSLSSSLSKPPPAAQLQTLQHRKGFLGSGSSTWGGFGRQEGKELPLHLPSPLCGRLMAAAVPAALRGSQAASQSSQHCRGCLLFLFSKINFSTAKIFPH